MVFLAVSCVIIVVVHCRYAWVYLISAVIAAVYFELLRNFQFPRQYPTLNIYTGTLAHIVCVTAVLSCNGKPDYSFLSIWY